MSFRFVVGDHVRVNDNSDFAAGTLGEITIVEYIPSADNPFDNAEYTVFFDEPIINNSYSGNEEWESPTFEQGYFNDDELSFADPKKRVKRTSGFGRFIRSLEDRHDEASLLIQRIEDA